jgi:hypothetical protein
LGEDGARNLNDGINKKHQETLDVLKQKKLTDACCDLIERIQRHDKAKCHQSLHDRLDEDEQKVQESNDTDDTQKKVAKATKTIISSEHRHQDAYDQIKCTIEGVSGTYGLDWLEVLLGNPQHVPVTTSQEPTDAREILLEVDDFHKRLLDWKTRNIFITRPLNVGNSEYYG